MQCNVFCIAVQQVRYFAFLQAVDAIDWPEGFVRRDIGWRAIERM